MCRGAVGVRRRSAGRGEDADAEVEGAQERVDDTDVAAAKGACAECEVREGEETVQQEERAKSPGEEDGEGRAERAQVEALDPLRAQPILPARRLAVAREESSTHRLRDDASEAEVGVVTSGRAAEGRRSLAVAVIDVRLGHVR